MEELCYASLRRLKLLQAVLEISDWTRLIVLGTYPQYRQNTQQLWDTYLWWTSHDTSDCRLLAGGA